MRDSIRRGRPRLNIERISNLGAVVVIVVLSATLITACFGKTGSGENRSDRSAGEPAAALSYFLASPGEGQKPAEMVSSTFRTLSGAVFDVWHERTASRTIRFSEFHSLRMREELAPPSFRRPEVYVVVEAELKGAIAQRFHFFQGKQSGEYLWVAAPSGQPVDFLPMPYALRVEGEGENQSLWIAAGRFRNREAAEAFFGGPGDVRQEYLALRDSERAKAMADNERLEDFAIWTSLCDPVALAELGGQLSERLPELPRYAERAQRVDCRVQPQLGGAADQPREPVKAHPRK